MIKNLLNFKNFNQIRLSLNHSISNLFTIANEEEKKKIKKKKIGPIDTYIKKIKKNNLTNYKIKKIKSIKNFAVFQESKNSPNQDKFNFRQLNSIKGKIFAIFDGYNGWQACELKSRISFKNSFRINRQKS